MLTYVRQAIATNGGTPHSFRPVDSWRELVTAYGGTPTKWSVIGVMREAITAVGGTPTKWTELELLRELLTALGVTPAGFYLRALYQQLAVADVTPTPTPTPTPAPTSSLSATAGYPAGVGWSFTGSFPVGDYAIAGDQFVVGATKNADSPATATQAANTQLFSDSNAVTFQDTGDTVTLTGHSLVANQKVRFSVITSTTGIVINTDYFVVTPTTNTFQLAATSGGAALPLTTNGTGTMFRYINSARVINGEMVDPGSNGSTGGADQVQGYDNLDTADAYQGSTLQDFSAGVNTAGTTVSGNKSLVKGKSVTAPSMTGRENLTDIGVLTIVSAVPYTRSFRPHPSDTDKTPFFRADEITIPAGGWPTLAVPGTTSLPTKAQIIAQLRIMQTSFTNNLFSRSIAPSNQQKSYGADIACTVAQALLYLCYTGPTGAEKLEVAEYLTQAGLDCWRRTVNGGRWPGLANASFGGGHAWVKPLIVFAAHMLRNSTNTAAIASLTDYANAASKNYFQNDRTVITVDRELIETVPNAGYFPVFAPYLNYMENAVDWNSKPEADAFAGSGFTQRYRTTNGNSNMAAILGLRLLGAASLWGAPNTFAYHDRYYRWWEMNSYNNDYFFTDQSATFLVESVKSFYTANSPEYATSTVPSIVRVVARDRHVWVEFDRQLDPSVIPAVSAFAVTVNAVGQTLPINRTTTLALAANNNAGTVASGTGIVQGMRAVVAGLPVPSHVSAVSGTAVTMDTSPGAVISSASITFSAVDIFGKSMAITLPTALASGDTVTLAYTKPGTNNAKTLGGGEVASFTATAATNYTGTLPSPAASIDFIDSGSALSAASRQISGNSVPPTELVKRVTFTVDFWLDSKNANDTILANNSGSSSGLRLYFATTADLRLLIGSQQLRMVGAGTALPTGKRIRAHFIIDLTATTYDTIYRATFVWNGGSWTSSSANNTSSTGVLDGSANPNINTILQNGLYIGGFLTAGAVSNALDGGFGPINFGWGDATLSLPANFSGSQFAYNANQGDNGGTTWGRVQQLYYPFSVAEANGGVPNRGYGGANSMNPKNIDPATEDLLTLYTVASGI